MLLQLDPGNVDAIVVLANTDLTEGKGPAKAISMRLSSISNATAHLDYANVLPVHQSLAQTQEGVRLDPDNATAQNNLRPGATRQRAW